jgi:hypothetical protein
VVGCHHVEEHNTYSSVCAENLKCDLDKSKEVELHAAFGAASGSGGDLKMAVWHPCVCCKV